MLSSHQHKNFSDIRAPIMEEKKDLKCHTVTRNEDETVVYTPAVEDIFHASGQLHQLLSLSLWFFR